MSGNLTAKVGAGLGTTKTGVRAAPAERYPRARVLLRGLVRTQRAKEREFTFSPSYLAFQLNLEDGEVPDFMKDVPGVVLLDGSYVVQDRDALDQHLRAFL